MEKKTLKEALEVYKNETEFIIDGGLTKLFTYNKEVCDFEHLSVYNKTVLDKWMLTSAKSRHPYYYGGLNLNQVALNSFVYSRLRDMAQKILTCVYMYNKEEQTEAMEKLILKGKQNNGKKDMFFNGIVKITNQKVSLTRVFEQEDEMSDDIVFIFDNDANLGHNLINIIFEELVKKDWCKIA